MNEEPNFIKYLSVILAWKKFIIINFLIVTIITVIISFALPKWYKSTASLLPPKQPDIFGSLSTTGSLLKGLGGLSKLGGLGQKSNAYNYFAILHSRTTMEAVIKKFDLISVYDIDDGSIEKAIKELDGNVAFEEETDENITIEVYDKDPIRAADMANYFVQLLNEGSIRLGTQEARSNREFIEQRLSEVNRTLHDAEEAMRKFQEKSGLILTPEQTTGVDATAAIYALKAKKEIEVAVLEHSGVPNNPILQQSKIELAELEKKISTIPKAGINSIRLYRDMIIQQKILEFLIPIYEQAKIDEQKDVPVLLILDKAVPAEKKSKPKRGLIIVLSSFIAFTFSIPMAFVLHRFRKLNKNTNTTERKLQASADKIASLYRIKD